MSVFIDNALPLLSLLNYLPKAQEKPDMTTLREMISQHLKKFQEVTHGIALAHEAHYCLCVVADEFIQKQPWSDNIYWDKNSFAGEYYHDALGGEGFFQIIDTALLNPEESQEILALTLLLIKLGFEGKYHFNNDEKLALYQKRIQQALKIDDTKLDTAYGHSEVSWKRTMIFCAFSMFLTIGLGYIAANLWGANKLEPQMNHLERVLSTGNLDD